MRFLHMSIAGGIMILAITLIRALTIYRLPKKTFLALWSAALLRLLIPFSLPSVFSLYSLIGRNVPAMTTNASAAILPALSMEVVNTASTSIPARTGAISAWYIAWIIGMAICTIAFAAFYRKSLREFQMSLPVENPAAQRWLQNHPLRRKISIRQSDRVSSPLTFGVLHPVILMPKKTDWMDQTALKYVLEHEFVHIQRFDTISKLFLIAAVCAHWFNPLALVMYILANRDLELSCDETVVRRFGANVRASYAKVLIRMEETRSGFAPIGSHFSKNAIEERITAIMKIKKTTIISIVMAALLIAGTITAFATSAQTSVGTVQAGAVTEENSASAIGSGAAFETGDGLKPSTEYTAIGITDQDHSWFYQGKPIAAIYDDNGGIYTDEKAEDGVYLNIRRDSSGKVSGAMIITRQEFRELADRHMNAIVPSEDSNTLMSYKNPIDGRTYYSFDDGKTFEPLTDAEFEALYPTQDVEWWTYDGYKAWLENEKIVLQNMLGERGWTSGDGDFIWTQEKIDETIAFYEDILKEIQNGVMYSKTVDQDGTIMISYNPDAVGLGR